MKNLNRILAFALLFTAFSSCEKTSNNSATQEEKVTLEVDNNSAALTESRVTYKNEPLFNAEETSAYNTRTVTNESSTLLERGELFAHIADVASPERSNDRTLSATHVSINNFHAYVTYHYNEYTGDDKTQDLYEGQVDIIDISDPTTPIIKSSAQTSDADFNTMCIDYNSTTTQQTLWIGASDYNIGGAIYELNLTNNELQDGSSPIRHKITGSNSVNGIARSADYLFASAGKSNGGNYIFNADNFDLLEKDTFTNAKYVTVTGTEEGDKQIVLISGENAQLLIYSIDENHTLLKTITLGSIQPESGKSVIFVKDDICWVSMGYAGLKAYNIETGNLVHTLSPAYMTSTSVTNGVALDNDYIYVANGDGGMYICEAIDEQVEIEVLEIYNYGASANYINVQNNLIFIANGRDGLKILRRLPEAEYETICDYDDDGTPECLESYDVCDNLRSHLAVMLPEYEDATTAHPDYFTYQQSIILTEPATVSVSFIDEGAAFKNSFGTYTYHINNTPTTTNELLNKMLIYPNASKLNAGGLLIPGATMKLIDTYPTGTNIGGFLMANSWVGKNVVESGIKEGYYTLYTDPQLNSNKRQQSLIFYDQECEAIIMTFEDVKLPGGDKDYNDCIMQIIVNPASAVDVSQFIQIEKED